MALHHKKHHRFSPVDKDQQLIDRKRYLDTEGQVPWRLGGGTPAGPLFAMGGDIHISPENRGKFTSYANSKGESVREAASSVLSNPNASPTLKKRANFARNAAKWNRAEGGTVDPPGDQPLPGFERRAGLLPGMDLTENLPYEVGGVKGRLKTFDSPWSKYFTDSSRKAGAAGVGTPETFTRDQYNSWKASYSGGNEAPAGFMEHGMRYGDMRRSFKEDPRVQSVSTGDIDFSRVPNFHANPQTSQQWQGVFRKQAFFPDLPDAPSHLGELQVNPTMPKPNFKRSAPKTPTGDVAFYGGGDPFRHYSNSHRRRMGYYEAGGNMGVDYDEPTERPTPYAAGGLMRKKYRLC